MSFGSVLTIAGQTKVAAAMQPGGTPLTITQIALGDGGGAAVFPSENRAELMNEVHRQPIDSVELNPGNTAVVIIKSTIPADAGGFWIREIGLYDADGDLVAYGSYPALEKPLLASGVGQEIIIRTHLAVSSTDAVTILIDPSIVNATQEWVNQQLKWDKIGEKPDQFPPAAHTHPISEVDDLQEQLDGKSNTGHGHDWDDISNVPTEFPPSAHQHPISDINGLQDALNSVNAALQPNRALRYFLNQI